MLKKYMSYLGILMFACFSFYYTDRAADIVKRNDPIMKEIMKNKDSYKVKSVNAIINNDEIIPGINGIKVNIDKSYSEMKKYNNYNDSTYVFEEITPTISLMNNYGKYIVKGNSNKNNIALVFKIIDSSYIDKINNILIDKNIVGTFFIDGIIMEDNINSIIELVNNKNEIENLGYDLEYSNDMFDWTNNLISSITKENPRFCYTEYKASEVIDLCKKNNMYTILPTINVSNYPFLSIKNNLENGSIISFSMNNEVIKELPSIISYIKQKGYNLVTLKELISENILY